MIVYLICYGASFTAARLGWSIPSGLALILGGIYLYWRDHRASGDLIHLRGLFCLFFIGGQGLSCMKLSRLQVPWSMTTWLCFFLAVVSFYLAFEAAGCLLGKAEDGQRGAYGQDRRAGGPRGFPGWRRRARRQSGPFRQAEPCGRQSGSFWQAERAGRQSGSFWQAESCGGQSGSFWQAERTGGPRGLLGQERRLEMWRYETPLFRSIAAVTCVSAAAFGAEALILGYVPFFVRGVPHAYSYFHVSGLHYFTVSCVLTPSLYVLYSMASTDRKKGRSLWALLLTLASLLIPVLCVSRFQLILAVGMAVFTAVAVNRRIRMLHVLILACLMVPAYVLLTIARSHDVAYLNGIFEMKSSAVPIYFTQPYMYIANNYDNFNCLVEQLPAHSWGLRMLFPLWALTGLKFRFPGLVAFPLYVDKEELTTLTLIYDAYYDLGVLGVVLFCGSLGVVCFLLVRGMARIKNPIGYVFYAQMAMYMMLSFFTTWFSNAATWFYFAVTGAIYLYVGGRKSYGR